MYWLKFKPGKGTKPSAGPSHPRPHPGRQMKIPERRILLPPSQPSRPRPGPRPRRILGKSKTQKELDDVLKKLKDMGK